MSEKKKPGSGESYTNGSMVACVCLMISGECIPVSGNEKMLWEYGHDISLINVYVEKLTLRRMFFLSVRNM